ncbi:MAG: type II toxin-antitoxin system Phd/YefM family antitoxin [Propionibacteriaceae bacterium]|jgi:antitoxin (DNA-binding transcriptional repressor) of toxin-antitoxin stability system|nr:type II toxin-antitoxin system Phd/YefM family antitoxin [Propionibacteriaceae bacterium]
MKYVSVRELRSAPGQVWAALAADGELVLTNNGRPQALMVDVDGDTLEATREALQQAKLMRLIARQQAESVASGRHLMTDAAIDSEIAAARTARRGD